MAHTMLANHIVERLVTAAAYHLRQIGGIGAQACRQQVAGDVLLGKDTLLGEQVVQLTAQLHKALVG